MRKQKKQVFRGEVQSLACLALFDAVVVGSKVTFKFCGQHKLYANGLFFC